MHPLWESAGDDSAGGIGAALSPRGTPFDPGSPRALDDEEKIAPAPNGPRLTVTPLCGGFSLGPPRGLGGVGLDVSDSDVWYTERDGVATGEHDGCRGALGPDQIYGG